MSNPIASIRALLVYAVCLPLAIFLGYMLAGPTDTQSIAIFGGLLFILLLPLFLKYHHVWLIISWNLAMTLYGVPGLPPAWFLMAFISFFIGLGHHILNRDRKYLHAPAVTVPLLFLGLVVFVTAQLTGGIGMRLLGSSQFGGKRYMFIALALLGYFAFISQPIPRDKRKLYITLFFLSGVTIAISDLFAFVNPSFYFIFLLFPPNVGAYYSLNEGEIARFGGLAAGSAAIVYTMLARYGAAGILDLRKLWRPVLFILCLGMSTLGGFRSIFGTIGLVFLALFYMEGLLRSRMMPALVILGLLCGTLCISFADRLPMTIQRTLSFLPIPVSEAARMNAESSSAWRFDIWQRTVPQIPKYLFLGKGLSLNGEELEEANAVQGLNRTEAVEIAGDYHSGPLSLIIPFGIFGTIGFLWFLSASISVLRANYLYGDDDCRTINRFLLAYFIVRAISYFLIFGSFYGDLYQYVGLIGLSISLNGGVAKKPAPTIQQIAENRPRFPLFRKPQGAA